MFSVCNGLEGVKIITSQKVTTSASGPLGLRTRYGICFFLRGILFPAGRSVRKTEREADICADSRRNVYKLRAACRECGGQSPQLCDLHRRDPASDCPALEIPMPKPQRICFDRVIPATYQPARAVAHEAAISRYAALVQNKAASASKSLPRNVAFGEHVQAIAKLGSLSASDPVHVARMAVINQKKWNDGYNLRCRFLDGDDFQRVKVLEKAQMWQQYANISINFVDDQDAE